jgi:putative nucleotidyltransferase with HDIG domain
MRAMVRVADPLDGEGAAALLAMLAERDRRTWEHSRVTAQWAGRLAFEMRIEPERSRFIECCALLHDIGKIVTPRRILLKPGPLDEVEWTIVRDHSAVGARILERVSSLARCAPIVRAHHERFDGNGYPDRLAGLNIPFEARMIAVADAFHAMIGDRPYARAVAPRAALQILRDGRGTQWDPDVVDAMDALVTRRVRDDIASPSFAYASTA